METIEIKQVGEMVEKNGIYFKKFKVRINELFLFVPNMIVTIPTKEKDIRIIDGHYIVPSVKFVDMNIRETISSSLSKKNNEFCDIKAPVYIEYISGEDGMFSHFEVTFELFATKYSQYFNIFKDLKELYLLVRKDSNGFVNRLIFAVDENQKSFIKTKCITKYIPKNYDLTDILVRFPWQSPTYILYQIDPEKMFKHVSIKTPNDLFSLKQLACDEVKNIVCDINDPVLVNDNGDNYSISINVSCDIRNPNYRLFENLDENNLKFYTISKLIYSEEGRFTHVHRVSHIGFCCVKEEG